ncbi:DUF4397 domain-containing protein [Gynurincola endophyticus]|uniref:DUF4397 domain-containing protein n=1 Tax=Gynurincola endophyticus TaxID=2479004 RepID=UPI000F8E2D83|nr:DUF4397 domain-containing protein [Gynurincola endophyticus]
MKFFSNLRCNLLALVSFVVLATGCLKNDIGDGARDPQSFVMLGHMALFAPRAELYLNDAKATNPLNVNALLSSYSTVWSNSYKVSFKKENSDSLLAATTSNFRFDSAKAYTLFTYSDYDSTTKLSVISDDFSEVTNNNCVIRFFNLSPDENAVVDVYVGDILTWSGRYLADHVEMPLYRLFDEKNPNTYDIKITKAGQPEEVLARRNTQTLLPGNAYTIWFTGVKDGVGNKEYNVFLQRAIFY